MEDKDESDTWSQEEYGQGVKDITYRSGTANCIMYLANINIY